MTDSSKTEYLPVMPNTETVVSTIKAEMARRGITQVRVAEVLGISTAGVSERFKGRTPIRVDELLAIAQLLDVPPALFLGEPSQAAS